MRRAHPDEAHRRPLEPFLPALPAAAERPQELKSRASLGEIPDPDGAGVMPGRIEMGIRFGYSKATSSECPCSSVWIEQRIPNPFVACSSQARGTSSNSLTKIRALVLSQSRILL